MMRHLVRHLGWAALLAALCFPAFADMPAQRTEGPDAQNTAVVHRPYMSACIGKSTAQTNVTDGDIQFGWCDQGGREHVTGDPSMSPLLTQPANLEITATCSAACSNLIGPQDVSNYASVSVQITAYPAGGTLQFVWSDDNVTWTPGPLQQLGASPLFVSAPTTTGQWFGQIQGRYFAVQFSSYTSGTFSAKAEFSGAPRTGSAVNASLASNTGIPASLPTVVQQVGAVSAAGQSSVTTGSIVVAVGNSLIVLCGGSSTSITSLLATDSTSDTFTSAKSQTGTQAAATVNFAVNAVGGPTTFTCTETGATSTLAVTAYEVAGLLAQVANQPDATDSNTVSATTSIGQSASGLSPMSPNEIAFASVVHTLNTASAITPGAGWTQDTNQAAAAIRLIPMRKALGSLTQQTGAIVSWTTSENAAMASATFRPVILGIEGSFEITDGTNKAKVASGGGLYSNLRNASGTEIGTATNPVQIGTNASAATVPLIVQLMDAGSGAIGIASANTAAPPSVEALVTDTRTVSTATETTVAGSASNVTLLAANTNRRGMHIYNDSTANLYVRFSATAASTSTYTIKMAANSYFEMPVLPIYTGQVNGIWDSAAGNARITEETP